MAAAKSVLIVGGSGFIGTHLALRLRQTHKVYSTFFKHFTKIPGVTHVPLDIDHRKWIKRMIYVIQPSIVIYAAGFNDLEWAEKNPKLADKIHAEGVASLAASLDILQPRFIYLSNPYVFDGSKGNYHENDILVPRTLLGRIKSSGESSVKTKCFNHVIIRSSPVYGRSSGKNPSFLDRLRMNLDRGRRVELSTQELYSFGPVEGLCDVIHRLLESGIRNRALHYGGLTRSSFFDFARAFAERFKYDPSLIVPKKRHDAWGHDFKGEGIETKPFDFSLNSTGTVEALKIKPLLLEEGFDLIEKNLIGHS